MGKFYHRYDGENCQRHLQESIRERESSRLNEHHHQTGHDHERRCRGEQEIKTEGAGEGKRTKRAHSRNSRVIWRKEKGSGQSRSWRHVRVG